MSKVSDTRGPHSHATFRATRIDLTMAIFSIGVPHKLISDRGVHFRAETDTLLQRYGATPYSLVYGMEAMLPVEIEMGSLRVALEQQIPKRDWAQARLDQLNILDERRLRVVDHVCEYQRKIVRTFKKRVKPRLL
ncbi:hypothetical protein CK203_101085 [Vitis vinifera]|uniref:Integrase catalytic domain-containing protein n=1 Tax=Vitis vinifera TaxID=29760 RepID=A0A438CFD4_VITVI|nr:hypothetical protein CK203_101085 [Vitis vinifera]